MKTLILLYACLFAFSLSSCDTTKTFSGSKADELADFFRGVSGLSVVGKGENATIKVRGMLEYYGEGEPLFVVDGLEISGGFYSLVNRIDASAIKSVRVLKHSSDLFKYGNLGVNGVVEISTL